MLTAYFQYRSETFVNQCFCICICPFVQANGLVERNNRTIQNSMLKILEQNQDQWPQVLTGVLLAYRSSKQSSTGFTPFFLLYGRTAKLPIECREEENPIHEIVAAYVEDDLQPDDVRQRLQTILTVRNNISQIVCENIIHAQDKQKRAYKARNLSKKAFKIGDKVLSWNLRRADRKGGRMSDPWLGPYTVSTITANGAYELTSKDGEVLRSRQHGVNLKLFLDRQDAVESKNNFNPDDVVEKPSKKRKLFVDISPEKQNGYNAEADASKDDDVTVTGSEEKCNFTFSPTQSGWRVYHSHTLSLAKPRRMEKRTKTTYLGRPTQVENVDGDGNCFFQNNKY